MIHHEASSIERPTGKQFGDACEMLVAGYLTLAGITATLMPDSWPDYDLIAQPRGKQPLRISVKARGRSRRERSTHSYRFRPEGWDWIAFVFVPQGGRPRFWILPCKVARDVSQSDGEGRRLPIARLMGQLSGWENNFSLEVPPAS
jgi:hypothetical protein